MNTKLLKDIEVDFALRYPPGRAMRLAKDGRLPFVTLPDGELRFDERVIAGLLNPSSPQPGRVDAAVAAFSDLLRSLESGDTAGIAEHANALAKLGILVIFRLQPELEAQP